VTQPHCFLLVEYPTRLAFIAGHIFCFKSQADLSFHFVLNSSWQCCPPDGSTRSIRRRISFILFFFFIEMKWIAFIYVSSGFSPHTPGSYSINFHWFHKFHVCLPLLMQSERKREDYFFLLWDQFEDNCQLAMPWCLFITNHYFTIATIHTRFLLRLQRGESKIFFLFAYRVFLFGCGRRHRPNARDDSSSTQHVNRLFFFNRLRRKSLNGKLPIEDVVKCS
jgi:hypothetical protein